jgi:hypothetical protein
MATTPLSGLRHVGFYLLFSLAEATLRTIGMATLLLALHAVVRDLRWTFALSFLLLAASFIDDATGTLAVRIVYAAIAAMVALVIVYRFGLLSLAACAYTILILQYIPITIDPSAWYFGRSAVVLALLTTLAARAFVTSLGGKRWIPDLALDA